MLKVTHYIILMVVLGASVVGYWVYQKYIRETAPSDVAVFVERGDLKEIVRARGEVATSKEYNLEFPTIGTVSNVYVKEGGGVTIGAPLMKLETRELSLETERLTALVNERSANLAKLTAGAKPADVAVYEARVASALSAQSETEKQEVLALRAVSSAINDAVQGTTDLFYSNPQSPSPKLSFYIADSMLQNSLENERVALVPTLIRSADFSNISANDNLHATSVQFQSDTQRVGTFLDNNAKALNIAISTPTDSTKIASWQTLVASARTALNTKASALALAEEAHTAAESALLVAQKELAQAKSPAREEDITAAKASLSEAQAQVKIVNEQIRKAVISAPESGRVVKVAYKMGETVRPGTPAVVLHAFLPKVTSDISELDIVRIREKDGNPVSFTFDALPDKTYTGKVLSVEPQKINKDDDTYYRVNFSLDTTDAAIRPGMTGDVIISISEKKNVVKIQEYATFKRDDVVYVRVERNGVVEEVPIKLGVSDGEYREVVSGLDEGEKVLIPTD